MRRDRARTAERIAFVFPGQGSQWVGMGVELERSSAVFAERLAACGRALSPFVDWSLEEVLRSAPGAPALERVDVVQPALFAVMVSLAALWRAFGVHPSVVVGHSQGEIAAAHVAGALSLDDAALLVSRRSQALQQLAGQGAMVAVASAATDVDALLERWGARLSVAAFNGPRSTVVSGDPEAVEQLLATCAAEGVWAHRVPVDYASHSGQVEGIGDQLLESIATMRPRTSEVPFFSTATGELMDTVHLDPDYWYRSLREPVRFAEATRALVNDGCSAFIEISPHPVLTMAVKETLADQSATDTTAVIGSLSRGEGDTKRFMCSLGEAFVNGVEVDWDAVFAGQDARVVDLPTYPFERERYWLSPHDGSGEVSASGPTGVAHPLLATAVRLAPGEAWLFTGQISLSAHPWLSDHTVLGLALLPGSAFVDLALRAGRETGNEEIHELTLEAPLIVPEHDEMLLQLKLSEPDESARRQLAIYSRPRSGPDGGGADWTRHATGVLARPSPAVPADPLSDTWPPAGAEPADVDYVYDRLAEAGVSYGPAFRGLHAAWRHGEELFAEVSLADEVDQAGFTIHPALLDAVLQALAAAAPRGSIFKGAGEPPGATMPFSWSGVRVEQGSSSLRARLSVSGDSLGIVAIDERGVPALSVDRLVLRRIDAARLRAAADHSRGLLFGLEWLEVTSSSFERFTRPMAVLGDAEIDGLPAARYPHLAALDRCLDARKTAIDTVLAPIRTTGETSSEIHDAAHRTLLLLQSWLADERTADRRLALITTGAVAVDDREAPDLAGAGVWGLVRSVQAEHPKRFVLIDLDGSRASGKALQAALALDEPQLAIREGQLLAPRLVSRETEPTMTGETRFDSRGTVLITGGTGELGALFARHLVLRHGVRRLLLASRRGLAAPGAAELSAELAALGCEVRVLACDVTGRGALAKLLASISSSGRPLVAVLHAAGLLDDGVLESLDRERLDRVMAPKVDAAIALDELTAELDLAAFVLFSSAVGTLGGAAQANYSAANAVLDALAQRRCQRGLPAKSLGWGLWAPTGQSRRAALDEDALSRLQSQVRSRMGMLPLDTGEGLALFDASLTDAAAVLVPVRLDMAALRANARLGAVSPPLRRFARGSAPSPHASRAAFRQRLEGAPASAREGILLELVRDELAAVLGYDSSADIDPNRTLPELGTDSLGAIDLRNRLASATGLPLATTIAFDHPTAVALVQHLKALLATADRNAPSSSPKATGTLSALLRTAHEQGSIAEVVPVLIEASRFGAPRGVASKLAPASRITPEGHHPRLICLPSFLVGSGPHQFVRLARRFQRKRSVTGLSLPGFRHGEPPPRTWSEAIEALAASLQAVVADEPYVLVGYSGGGALAHAVAERCEVDGPEPAGLVMIDTYAPSDRPDELFATAIGELMDRPHEYLQIDDDGLIAMATYMRLCTQWRPRRINTPAVLLRASDSLGSTPNPQPSRFASQLPHTVVEVSGDHFSLIEAQAAETARAIDAWLQRGH